MRTYKRHIERISTNKLKNSIKRRYCGVWDIEYDYDWFFDYDDDYDDYDDYEEDHYWVIYDTYPMSDYPEISKLGYGVVDMYSIYPPEVKRVKIIDDILS